MKALEVGNSPFLKRILIGRHGENTPWEMPLYMHNRKKIPCRGLFPSFIWVMCHFSPLILGNGH